MIRSAMASCYSCGTELEIDRVYRTSECPGCGKSVKVCKNCKFYEPGAQWDCRETISEPIRDKDRVNYCEYFQLAESNDRKVSTRANAARQDLDKLFGD